MRRLLLACLVLGLLLPAPVGAFGHEGGLPETAQDVNARPLNVLAYHPFPDPEGDPWGVPYADRNGTRVDYMQAAYDAYLYPTAVFDGVDSMASASQFLETYNAYEGAYLDRAEVDSPIRLGVTGGLNPPMALLQVEATAKAPIASDNLTLRAALFEDDLEFDGGNGVDLHRFTVRRIVDPVAIDLSDGGNVSVTLGAPTEPAWAQVGLGFVVWVVNHDADARGFAKDEVLQSTTFMMRQTGPTIQSSKGVLLEYYTATWCPTCVYGDGAVDELANTYGVQSSRILDRAYLYYRPFGVGQLAAAVGLAALAAVMVARVRAGGGGSEP